MQRGGVTCPRLCSQSLAGDATWCAIGSRAQHTVWVSLLPQPSCCFSPTPQPRWSHRVTEIRPLTVSQLLVQHHPHSKEALCHGDAPSLPAVLLTLRAQLDLLSCIGPGLYSHPPLCQSLLLGDQDLASPASDWLHNRGQITPPLCILTVLLYRGNNTPYLTRDCWGLNPSCPL